MVNILICTCIHINNSKYFYKVEVDIYVLICCHKEIFRLIRVNDFSHKRALCIRDNVPSSASVTYKQSPESVLGNTELEASAIKSPDSIISTPLTQHTSSKLPPHVFNSASLAPLRESSKTAFKVITSQDHGVYNFNSPSNLLSPRLVIK